MAYLEANAPYNSHVLFVGLVDGRVLWDIMNAETHRTWRGEPKQGRAGAGPSKGAGTESRPGERGDRKQGRAGAGTAPPPQPHPGPRLSPLTADVGAWSALGRGTFP